MNRLESISNLWSDIRLDNRSQLCQIYLDRKRCSTLSKISDSDLVLECYRKAGEDIAANMAGRFACTLWDEKKEHYWCIRDQLGDAAFYYTFFEGDFISSPTLSRLLGLLPTKPKPNIQAMKEFVWYNGTINPEYTMYEGIYRLPPGHQMIVKNGRTTLSRYWHPKSIDTDNSITLEEASEKFIHLFRKAVSCRLAADGKTGCELSGGLDSSSVFCIGEEEGGNLEAYSMRCRGMKCDEGDYIEQVLRKTGREGYDVDIGGLDYESQYDLNYYYTLSPHWPLYSTSFFQFPLLEAMQKNGITMALSGQGGDHVMIGSPMLCVDLLLDMRFREFWNEYRKLIIFKKMALGLFAKTMLGNILPAPLYESLKRAKYMNTLGEVPPPKSYRDYHETSPHTRGFVETGSIQNIASASHTMYADTNIYRTASEHFGIDFHHPFFDVRVVEFLLSVPHQFKYSQGNFRQLHREAMKGVLPESIRTRRDKAAFNDMSDQHLKAAAEGFDWRDAHVVRLGILKQETLDRLQSEYEKGVLGKKDYAHISLYWRLINLEQWYRFHYDKDRV